MSESRRVDLLLGVLKEIAAGKVQYDNEHPLGPDASMAGRFIELAKNAITSIG